MVDVSCAASGLTELVPRPGGCEVVAIRVNAFPPLNKARRSSLSWATAQPMCPGRTRRIPFMKVYDYLVARIKRKTWGKVTCLCNTWCHAANARAVPGAEIWSTDQMNPWLSPSAVNRHAAGFGPRPIAPPPLQSSSPPPLHMTLGGDKAYCYDSHAREASCIGSPARYRGRCDSQRA